MSLFVYFCLFFFADVTNGREKKGGGIRERETDIFWRNSPLLVQEKKLRNGRVISVVRTADVIWLKIDLGSANSTRFRIFCDDVSEPIEPLLLVIDMYIRPVSFFFSFLKLIEI